MKSPSAWNRHTWMWVVAGIGVLVLVVGVGWAWLGGDQGASQPAARGDTLKDLVTSLVGEVPKRRPPRRVAKRTVAPKPLQKPVPTLRNQVRDEVAQIETIFTKVTAAPAQQRVGDIMRERREKLARVVSKLASMGAGGAAALEERYNEPSSVREKISIIRALASIQDADASSALARVYESDQSYTSREEIIKAMGAQGDTVALETLQQVLQEAEDHRIRILATQALGSHPSALPWLADAVFYDKDKRVQGEAIRAIGRLEGDEATAALGDIASEEGGLNEDLRLRARRLLRPRLGEQASAVP